MSLGDSSLLPSGAFRELALRGLRVGVLVELRRRLVTKGVGGVFDVGKIMRIVSVRDDGQMTLEGVKQVRVGMWVGDRRIVGPVPWQDVVVMAKKEPENR